MISLILCFTSCSSDDADETDKADEEVETEEISKNCMICYHYLFDKTVCDNEDGTVTVDSEEANEIIKLDEGVTFVEYADDNYGNCYFNVDLDDDGVIDVGELTDCVICNGNTICKDRNGNAVFNGVTQVDTSYQLATYAQFANGIPCEEVD